ncbi:hypothetical protein CF319_g8193 [Tilletia indica]|uniref:Uncharacterized protein n=1 Tax=Tilletia indica TaxID=43049 RepID=A0A8T8SHG7_9BASI|nr:hypothetical protein CF319_g8193 [Tilletia indica]KAE8240320.1 hypothetical protein A4X13_0g7857 [Tilletia indica]
MRTDAFRRLTPADEVPGGIAFVLRLLFRACSTAHHQASHKDRASFGRCNRATVCKCPEFQPWIKDGRGLRSCFQINHILKDPAQQVGIDVDDDTSTQAPDVTSAGNSALALTGPVGQITAQLTSPALPPEYGTARSLEQHSVGTASAGSSSTSNDSSVPAGQSETPSSRIKSKQRRASTRKSDTD